MHVRENGLQSVVVDRHNFAKDIVTLLLRISACHQILLVPTRLAVYEFAVPLIRVACPVHYTISRTPRLRRIDAVTAEPVGSGFEKIVVEDPGREGTEVRVKCRVLKRGCVGIVVDDVAVPGLHK